ncbi:MAG: hypothetical protein QM689_00010 [Oscillospiraceae bacterium]
MSEAIEKKPLNPVGMIRPVLTLVIILAVSAAAVAGVYKLTYSDELMTAV